MKKYLKNSLSSTQIASCRFLVDILRGQRTISRHFNMIRFKKSVCKTEVISYIPPVFVATISDACNLRCPNCLYLLEDPNHFSHNIMEPDMFASTLEKYNHSRKAEVIFLTGGEPLLHPDLETLINISLSYGLDPKISTNGILVEKRLSALTKLSYINVSLDAYDYKSFETNRGGTPKQFDAIMAGLKALKREGLFFSISFVLTSSNILNLDEMLAIGNEIKPDFVYFHNINPHGCDGVEPLSMQNESTRFFLNKLCNKIDYPFDIQVSTIFDSESPTFLTTKCIQPWYYFCFNTRGDISYCCHLKHKNNIGNVADNYDFNSAGMKKFRKNIIAGKIMNSCLYCQRRFMGKEFGNFNRKDRRWSIN